MWFKKRLNKGLEHGEGYGDLLTGHCTGQLRLAGAVLGVGTVYRRVGKTLRALATQ
jgi:hypothetical protein